MTQINALMEAEYNNRARVPEHPLIFERWHQDAQAYRDAALADQCGTFDQPYGPHARQKVDLFFPKSGVLKVGAPWMVFLHGGYWQAMDRKVFSHFARGMNLRGYVVAIPSYPLCPEVSMDGLAGCVRECCVYLQQVAVGAPFVLCGHSAGGHLTGLLMGSEPAWSLPIHAGLTLSSIFDLKPLVETGLNRALRLTVDDAIRLSPIHQDPQKPARPLIAAVGSEESGEFLRQSRVFVEAWSARGGDATYWEVPNINHFTIVDGLALSDSALVQALVGLAS